MENLNRPEVVTVRYIVSDVATCTKFYTEMLNFKINMAAPSGFAMLQMGNLRLLLNEPGAGGAGQKMTDGSVPTPGGWNRIQLQTNDLEKLIAFFRQKGAQFRGDIVNGNGGKQILLLDPAGNLIELTQPKDL